MGVAFACGIAQPIVKRIWSASFTLYSAGWCYLLLALSYWWIDVKGHTKGWDWFLYFGCNAITAYLIGELVNFCGIAASLLYAKRPSELKMIFIDPKGTEFTPYRNLYRHYLAVTTTADSEEDEIERSIAVKEKDADYNAVIGGAKVLFDNSFMLRFYIICHAIRYL